MKIIGWNRKGNVVRFALGKDDLEYWSGDAELVKDIVNAVIEPGD